jgi:hypothetical protein
MAHPAVRARVDPAPACQARGAQASVARGLADWAADAASAAAVAAAVRVVAAVRVAAAAAPHARTAEV